MNSIIKKADKAYGFVVTGGSYLQSVILLIVRLYWGWQFFRTGMGKFGALNDVAEFFDTLNISLPMASAVLVATTECVGGLLLVIGLASRLAALPLTITMIVAYIASDRESLRAIFWNPDDFLSATPFQFLFASLLILAFGPGAFSVDYLIKWFVKRKSESHGTE
jgi:putative oxidoreductase